MRIRLIKMAVFSLIVFSYLFTSSFVSASGENNQMSNRVVFISIPKCGTFLMNKCLKILMRNDQLFSRLKEPSILMKDYMFPDLKSIKASLLRERFVLWGHPVYNAEQASWFSAAATSLFFLYRDPRDQIISLYFFMKKESLQHPTRYFWNWVHQMTIDEFIFKMIDNGTMVEECPEAPHGIREFYEIYEPYLTMDQVCKIRFEDLVGAKGGGSKKQQEIIIKAIADNLNIPLGKESLDNICDSLYGVSTDKANNGYSTFREGQVGSWRKYFSEEHKLAFKAAAGDLLIRWGYEKDLNW